ncbi:alpha-1,3-mannosyl-glycoprotein 4-beta-N-acetylglucosaminyltransferase C-like, partial [Xenia sp. Carnegie-2017]|uniref:alpha-1,3-mannosyl-glycoprotein 4-beta-N-acetylglucosaminyltransferase C-like n=1 Tax=Xenia sp. Carnegie-2017 TaxID=2897299 RepID=UPI001F04D513
LWSFAKIKTSLESLFRNLPKSSSNVTVVVPLRDCGKRETNNFLKTIKNKYKYWIDNNGLKIMKIPGTFKLDASKNGLSQFWGHYTNYTQTYIKKAKFLIRVVTFLWTFSMTRSEYFILFTDHMTIQSDILQSVMTAVNSWKKDKWLWYESIPGSIEGSIYKTRHFHDLLQLINIFGNHMPLNYILKFYRRNFRISKGIKNIHKQLPVEESYEFKANNPAATVSTSLEISGGVSIQSLYENRQGFFWSWPPKKGDYIKIDLKSFLHIKRVRIETGSFYTRISFLEELCQYYLKMKTYRSHCVRSQKSIKSWQKFGSQLLILGVMNCLIVRLVVSRLTFGL